MNLWYIEKFSVYVYGQLMSLISAGSSLAQITIFQ